MKKMFLILTAMMPMVMFAEDVLGDTQAATNATGTMIGTLLFIAVVSIWMLPLVFGVMVYSGQKKRAEQQHEEVGMKAALYALVAIIIGAAASYYVVGSIGKLAGKKTTLDEGNGYFLKPLFDKGTPK
jgi:EamA domain-containing membrane protein RarD